MAMARVDDTTASHQYDPVQSLTESTINSLPPSAINRTGCEYLKSRGANILHKLLAMARCSVHSRKLVSDMKQELAKCLPHPMSSPPAEIRSPPGLLRCSTCNGHMTRPVCLPCGHSHCLLCLEKPSDQGKDTVTCSRCQETHLRIPVGFQTSRRPTLMLQNICSKYYPKGMIDCCLEREQGNQFAQDNNFQMAVEHYNRAVDTGFADHRVFSNRSRAHIALGNMDEALQDAEKCCSLLPHWPKGHYRRGRALDELGRCQESAAAYLLSLHYGEGELQCLCQALDKLIVSHKCSSLDTHHLIASIVSIAVESASLYEKMSQEEGSDTSILLFDQNQTDVSDFECVLCACLLFCPVTVPCGHSFCRSCLARLFDHSPFCPVCRSSLGEMFAQHTQLSGQMCVDESFDQLTQHLFPLLYQEKIATFQEERLRLSRIGLTETEELPIFVCTMGFPGMSCPLHIFEPRYRLMMRRCIESNSRRFGICAPADDTGSFVDYGTVLFISSLEYTPDGRSLVTTVGERRFQVLERSTRDGYSVARIRFISDEPVETDASLQLLLNEVYRHAMTWLHALPFFTRLMVMQSVSSPPPTLDATPTPHDGPSWVWWFINALPTSHHNKIEFLRSTSLIHRLQMLKESLPLPAR